MNIFDYIDKPKKFTLLSLQDDNVFFSVCKEYETYYRSVCYSKQFGKATVMRFVHRENNVDCRIYLDNIVLLAGGISKDNWRIEFNDNNKKLNFIRKYKAKYNYAITYGNDDNFKTITVGSNEPEKVEVVNEELTVSEEELLEEAIRQFRLAISKCNSEYDGIENKEEFDKQFIELLKVTINDEKCGYCEDSGVKDEIDDLSFYIENFKTSEKEFPKLKNLFTYDYIIKKHSELKLLCDKHNVSYSALERIIKESVANWTFLPDIFYNQEDIEKDIVDEIKCKIEPFRVIATYEDINQFKKEFTVNRIKSLYSELINKINNKTEFFKQLDTELFMCFLYPYHQPSEIVARIESFIKSFLQREIDEEKEYEDFILKYGNNQVHLDLTPYKKELFKRKDLGEDCFSDEENLDYLVYTQLYPEYDNFVYNKNRRLNTSISRMPKWVDYFYRLLDLFVKYDIVTLDKDNYIFKSFDNIELFAEELVEL